MKEQKLYVCERCNTSYKDKDKALCCEEQHIEAKKINLAKYHSKSTYPDFVNILFDNGEVVRYRRDG